MLVNELYKYRLGLYTDGVVQDHLIIFNCFFYFKGLDSSDGFGTLEYSQ